MTDLKNLILAIVLSILVMVGWRVIFNKISPEVPNVVNDFETGNSTMDLPKVDDGISYASRNEIIQNSKNDRIKIFNNKLHGSILLKGARFDDLTLANYHATTDPNSEEVVLLSPVGSAEVYFVEFGWVDAENKVKLPNNTTVWQSDKSKFSQNDTVNLFWDNKEGVIFRLKISLDDHYMFKVEQIVENHTNSIINLKAYGRINRSRDISRSFWISHEGAIGVFNNTLEEWTYKDVASSKSIKVSDQIKVNAKKDWIGFADKYWFTSIIPDNNKVNEQLNFYVKHAKLDGESRFQVDFSRPYHKIYNNNIDTNVNYLFVGAKELKLLDKYAESLNISLFDKAVDFGVLYFITKPVFMLLEYFNRVIGNFGLAIILLTIFIKLLMLSLSNKSYISMFKLRQLQPSITRLKELYKSDNVKLNKEISALFKKNNVNPMSGFLPIIIQIPVFFALYKVLFVTIEMRHAPFYLWIKDLSSQDPANILTLFGLLKYNPPICIGILPIILGITMIIQQKINDTTSTTGDQFQMNIMKFLPYIFIFIFASFPAGLVLYWICSNIITVVQQLVIKYVFMKKNKIIARKVAG